MTKKKPEKLIPVESINDPEEVNYEDTEVGFTPQDYKKYYEKTQSDLEMFNGY